MKAWIWRTLLENNKLFPQVHLKTINHNFTTQTLPLQSNMIPGSLNRSKIAEMQNKHSVRPCQIVCSTFIVAKYAYYSVSFYKFVSVQFEIEIWFPLTNLYIRMSRYWITLIYKTKVWVWKRWMEEKRQCTVGWFEFERFLVSLNNFYNSQLTLF